MFYLVWLTLRHFIFFEATVNENVSRISFFICCWCIEKLLICASLFCILHISEFFIICRSYTTSGIVVISYVYSILSFSQSNSLTSFPNLITKLTVLVLLIQPVLFLSLSLLVNFLFEVYFMRY